MIFQKEPIDSEVFGFNVLQIKDIHCQDNFQEIEKEYQKKHNPFYVYAKIEIEKIPEIHFLEDHGFRFMEYQMRMSKKLPQKLYDTSFDDVVIMEKVLAQENIDSILSLADTIFTNDRIYIDPYMGKELSQKRYRAYIQKSHQSSEEELVKFYDKRTQNIISFHTHKSIDNKTILHFLGGVAPEYQGTGACFACEYSLFNSFIQRGIKKIITHISGSNYPIMNFEFKTMDFKPEQAFIVLRKIYEI
ncbi:MAG: hypothetical protein HUU50_01760 [Candidatus Brocadiae bacterium]|nr:hypothetical protein [Candidatus Brocadiia bacterium]